MKASVFIAACLLVGCTSGPQVQTDHDPAADFRPYSSYAWTQQPQITNPLLKQRIVAAIDAELQARGWRSVAEAEADVVLVGTVAVHEDVVVNYYYDSNAWVGSEWRSGGTTGVHRMEPRAYKVGTLVLDMFDASSRRAVWRATAEGTVPASEAQQGRDALVAVQRMFADFPRAAEPSR